MRSFPTMVKSDTQAWAYRGIDRFMQSRVTERVMWTPSSPCKDTCLPAGISRLAICAIILEGAYSFDAAVHRDGNPDIPVDLFGLLVLARGSSAWTLASLWAKSGVGVQPDLYASRVLFPYQVA